MWQAGRSYYLSPIVPPVFPATKHAWHLLPVLPAEREKIQFFTISGLLSWFKMKPQADILAPLQTPASTSQHLNQ
jgi:hypothetical protein